MTTQKSTALFSLLLAATAAAQANDDDRALAAAFARLGDRLIAATDARHNACLSPASAGLALALAYAGARGETAAEMARVLGPADWTADRFHAACGRLQRRLARDDKKLRIACAQDLWPQTGHKLLPAYLKLLQDRYEAHPTALDFRGNVDGARRKINERIAAVTKGRIAELLQPGDLDATTRLVLTNALWLKADWEHPFEAGGTSDRPFHLTADTEVRLPTMHLDEELLTAATDGFDVVRLRYTGGDFGLDLALPKGESTLAATLTGLLTGEWQQALRAEAVDLALPRFHIEMRQILNDALIAAGMGRAFTSDADFSGVDGAQNGLEVDLVLQQTWFDVDEKGTEAAAATAIVKRLAAAVHASRKLHFDRPFAFALRDLETGLVLFAGRCVDPRGSGGQ